jgi:hypothetical protein
MEVDSVEPEPGSPLEKTLTAMRERGVKLIYGNWLIEGAPRVILFDTGSMYHRSVPLPPLGRLKDRQIGRSLMLSSAFLPWQHGRVEDGPLESRRHPEPAQRPRDERDDRLWLVRLTIAVLSF